MPTISAASCTVDAFADSSSRFRLYYFQKYFRNRFLGNHIISILFFHFKVLLSLLYASLLYTLSIVYICASPKDINTF